MMDPRILGFARRFITTVDSHRDVRSEALAEAFREATGLGAFPHYRDLCEAAAALDVRLEFLPTDAPMDGVNAWDNDDGPMIGIRADLTDTRAETTFCHELRELLENAFKRVKPAYRGLDTHDNAQMNPRSDAFAAALLLQSDAMHERLAALGYDMVRFTNTTRRSLASVLKRAQSVLSAGSTFEGPVAGIWLYEAAWDIVQCGTSAPEDLRVIEIAKLKGFSVSAKNPSIRSLVQELPAHLSGADEYPMVAAAALSGSTKCALVGSPDLFDGPPYVAVAEPLMFREEHPYRVVFSVVKRDSLALMQQWIQRLDVQDDLARARPVWETPWPSSTATPVVRAEDRVHGALRFRVG